MMNSKIKFLLCLSFWAVGFLSLIEGAQKAKIVMLKGNATVLRFFKKIPVVQGMSINAKDIIKTDKTSSASVELPDGSIANIGPGSRLKMTRFVDKFNKNQRAVQLDLIIGAGKFKVNKLKGNQSFIIKTPTAVAGVRGTEFIIKHRVFRGRPITSLLVKEGRVGVQSRKFAKTSKATIVKAMESSSVSGGGAPSEPVAVSVKEVSSEEESTGTADSTEASEAEESKEAAPEKKAASGSASEKSKASVSSELKSNISSAIKQIVSPVRPRAVKNTQVERIIKQIDTKRIEQILIARPPKTPQNSPKAQ
jgi:hypothetical protein